MQNKFTIQDIFLEYGDEYIKNHKLSKEQWKVFNAIRNCGTKNLGYHICTCEECGEEYFGFNSCRNRHCPMCQNYAREKWIQKESSYLLVTGGGIKNNQWVPCDKDYLFKVQVLGSLFRGKFLFYLKREFDNLKLNEDICDIKSFNKFLEPLYKKAWITYIEPPKGKAKNVIEYVSRYSFRVAISNERIKDVEDGLVTFEYKDYKDDSKIKEMTITTEEFIRRFLLHVLPEHFTKIKHYGLLTNRNKKVTLGYVAYSFLEF